MTVNYKALDTRKKLLSEFIADTKRLDNFVKGEREQEGGRTRGVIFRDIGHSKQQP